MWLDLEFRIRTDPKFRADLELLRIRLAQSEELSKGDPSRSQAFHEALLRYLEFCHFNLANLTPYFWPAYPKDSPLSFANFPFAYQMFNFQIGGFQVFRAARQIAKSTAFVCRQTLWARAFPSIKSLYIVPRAEQLKTYQNRFREIELANRFYRRETKLRQNLGYKEFPNGSVVEMAYVQSSAAAIRGKSTDELLFDEFQNFDPELELEVTQTQAASEIRSTIYAGTSLTTDSALEQKWEQSSQGSWVVKCSCGHYNIPLPPDILEMIRPQGPSCVKCGRVLNVRDGKFVHAYPDRFEAGFRGYHIPSVVVPAVVYNPVRWAGIYAEKIRSGAGRKFHQEVLGIATESGEREITRSQLEAICILGRDLDALRFKAQNGGYEYVVSGCDWGGSDHVPEMRLRRSTTVHVILGVLPTGECDILRFRRYEGMDYDSITADILNLHATYRGHSMATDFGVGGFYNSALRKKIPPRRHVIFCFVGPSSPLVNASGAAHQFNQYSLNKSESISLTYDAVRRRKIRCFDFQLAEPFLQDFLNLIRAPGESASGANTWLYRSHPNKPNDALMAVTFAFMLAKILRGEPMLADVSLKLALETALLDGGPNDPFGAISG